MRAHETEYGLLWGRLKRKPTITQDNVKDLLKRLPADVSMQERRRRIDALEEKRRTHLDEYNLKVQRSTERWLRRSPFPKPHEHTLPPLKPKSSRTRSG